MNFSRPVFLCAAKRSPIGSFGGSLASETATNLAAAVIKSVLVESGLHGDAVEQLIMGCVLTANTGQAPARQACITAGLPLAVQAMTVNKVCSSGLKAVLLAAQEVSLGNAQVVIAGGAESMSQAPYYLPTLRNGARLGHSEVVDSIIRDGLWDPYGNVHMGSCAELCAREYKLSREMQDAFALESYRRANETIVTGKFKREIAVVEITVGKNSSQVAVDEEPGKLRADKVPQLRPVFEKQGTVTAANASSINDGAAFMVVATEEAVKRYSLKPMARLIGQGWHAQQPEWFTTAPVGAVKKLLIDAQLAINDIDLFEINEAFSAVALACQGDLGIDAARLNIRGGAVALGHPIGASGARILTTLMHALQDENKKYGVAAICNGGGEATAALIEAL